MVSYSHPNKKLLDHLNNVKEIGINIFEKKDNLKFSISKNVIKRVLSIILYYHDIGKATVFFQDYLQASMKNRKCKYKKDLINHALLSATIAAYLVKKELDNDLLAAMAFVCVRKHHGNFKEYNDMLALKKKNILKKQFDSLNFSEFDNIKSISFDEIYDNASELLFVDINKNIENYFLMNLLFSILTYSDKTDAIFGEIPIKKSKISLSKYIDNYKKIVFSGIEDISINQIRNDIYQKTIYSLTKRLNEGNIFSLNVPTGAGKTLTALNLAFNLLDKNRSLKRVIYAFPFTSIIDQTEKILKDIFKKNQSIPEDYITVHHHLADIKIKIDEEMIEGDRAEFLIENWDKPVILTTFWQLFNSLLTNRNSRLRKFHNITNSVIILDEVQTIPYKYWNLTNEIFKELTTVLNCKIIFLTATMPLIFDENKGEIVSLIAEKERNNYFKKFSRYKVKLLQKNISDKIIEVNIEELVKIALNNIDNNKRKSFLFVFNTIKSSIDFFRKLKEYGLNKEFIYLSTNILPSERKKRIDKIKKNPENKIVISTQVIEAGVDIDLDIVYRDFAPLDSIIQTAGRCNRNNTKEESIVYLFKLKNEKEKFDYSYIYKGVALNATEKLLFKRNEFDESDLLTIIYEYYQEVKNNASSDESREILESIKELDYESIDNKFRLIEEIPNFLMFLEIDDAASEVLDKFKNILSIKDQFERKNEFLKIKSRLYQYVLSVKLTNHTKSYCSSLEDVGNFKVVERDLIDSVYNVDTGLIRIKDLGNFI